MKLGIFFFALFFCATSWAVPAGLDTPELHSMEACVYGVRATMERWAKSSPGDVDSAKACISDLANQVSTFFSAYRSATANNPLSQAEGQITQKLASKMMADLQEVLSANKGNLASMFSVATISGLCKSSEADFAAVFQQLRRDLASLKK